jgi:MFS family permease
VATVYGSLLGLFIARIGAGVAGATIGTAQAYIADSTTKENRAKGMALIGLGFALGFILGPMIGGVALFFQGHDFAQSPWPGFFASALSGVALLLALFSLPESYFPGVSESVRERVDRRAIWSALATPSIGLLLCTSFLAIFCFANFETTLSREIKLIVSHESAGGTDSSLLTSIVGRVRGWGYEKPRDIELVVVYLVFAYLGFVLTLAQGFLVRRLAGRISEGTMALGGAVLAIIGFVLLAISARTGTCTYFLLTMPIEVTGFAFVNPALQSMISRRTDPAQQGSVLGFAQTAATLARMLAPIMALRLFESSPDWPYWAAAALLAPGLLMIVASARGGRDFTPAAN